MLQKAGVRPFRASMFLQGMAGVHQVTPDQATPNLLADARRVSLEQTEEIAATDGSKAKGVKDKLDKKEAKSTERDVKNANKLAREILRKAELNKALIKGFKEKAPITYAVAVVGPASAIQGLASNPEVASVEFGVPQGKGRVSLASPQMPIGLRLYFDVPRLQTLSPDQLRVELDQLAR